VNFHEEKENELKNNIISFCRALRFVNKINMRILNENGSLGKDFYNKTRGELIDLKENIEVFSQKNNLEEVFQQLKSL
jgi:hypothetical protein